MTSSSVWLLLAWALAMPITDPTDIPDLIGDFRAANIAGLSSGDPVGQWNNGFGTNHATQGTGSAKPTYRTGDAAHFNGDPHLEFDGGDWLAANGLAAALAASTQGYTIVTNAKKGFGGSTFQVICELGVSTTFSPRVEFGLLDDFGGTLSHVAYDNTTSELGRAKTDFGESIASGTVYRMMGRARPSTALTQVVLNGVPKTARQANVYCHNASIAKVTIGDSADPGIGNRFFGRMTVFFVFARFLTDTEVADLDAWIVASGSNPTPPPAPGSGTFTLFSSPEIGAKISGTQRFAWDSLAAGPGPWDVHKMTDGVASLLASVVANPFYDFDTTSTADGYLYDLRITNASAQAFFHGGFIVDNSTGFTHVLDPANPGFPNWPPNWATLGPGAAPDPALYGLNWSTTGTWWGFNDAPMHFYVGGPSVLARKSFQANRHVHAWTQVSIGGVEQNPIYAGGFTDAEVAEAGLAFLVHEPNVGLAVFIRTGVSALGNTHTDCGLLGRLPAQLVIKPYNIAGATEVSISLPDIFMPIARCGFMPVYTIRADVTVTDTNLTVKALAMGPGVTAAGYWQITQSWSIDASTAAAIDCGGVGLYANKPAYSFPAQAFQMFQRIVGTWTGGSCASTPPSIPPQTPPTLIPGAPCALFFTVFERDRVTPAWEISTDKNHPFPYLQEPADSGYGEQEVDFPEGRATITDVGVRFIDIPITPGDQDSGFATFRLADGNFLSALQNRRGRLVRFIDATLPPVVIADGPISAIRQSESYAGYRVTVRDTREGERKTRAFDTTDFTGTCVIFPAGVTNGWGHGVHPTDPNLSIVLPTGGLSGVVNVSSFANIQITSPLGVNQRVFVDLTTHNYSVWIGPNSQNNVTTPFLYLTDEQKRILLKSVANLDPTTGLYRHTWPNARVEWRPLGNVGAFTSFDPVLFSDSPTAVAPNSLVRTTISDITYEDVEGVTRTAENVRTGYAVWLDPLTVAELPTQGSTVDVRIVYKGPPTEYFPYHFEGPAGVFLKNLYDGQYSRRDQNGNLLPTGIRYNAAALALLTHRIQLRLTETIDDIRAWAEENIYKLIGYAPTLNLEGEIHPRPHAYTIGSALDTLDIDNTSPRPSWEHGDLILNTVRVKYDRMYALEIPDPFSAGHHGDMLRVDANVVQEFREPDSIEEHTEHVLEIDSPAIVAYADFNRAPFFPASSELGFIYGQTRALTVLPRYAWGTPICKVPVLRSVSKLFVPGDFVTLDYPWMPDYFTHRRGLFRDAQIIAIADLNCAWREITMEAVEIPTAGVVGTAGGMGFGGAMTYTAVDMVGGGHGFGGENTYTSSTSVSAAGGTGFAGNVSVAESADGGVGFGGAADESLQPANLGDGTLGGTMLGGSPLGG